MTQFDLFSIPYVTEVGILLAASAGGLLITLCISSLTTPKFDYDQKHVVVTGGSSGIGLECAKIYAVRGANVTIVARDKGKLTAAMDELRACQVSGRHITSISVDTSAGQNVVDAAFASCIRERGPVDVIVNCAGTSTSNEFDKTAPEEFERLMRINLLGSIYPTRAVIASMKSTGCGRIVFVSSQVAQVAIHGFTAYGASKWALRGLAEALQMEVKPYGILVSVAYPPDTDTPGYKEEMLTKPDFTKKLSESGSVFTSKTVAEDIVNYSGKGYYGISTGLDGWLLKQVHPGMTPVNNIWEVVQGILFSPLCRIIGLFYVIGWESDCRKKVRNDKKLEAEQINRNASKVSETPSKSTSEVSMRVTRGSAKKMA